MFSPLLQENEMRDNKITAAVIALLFVGIALALTVPMKNHSATPDEIRQVAEAFTRAMAREQSVQYVLSQDIDDGDGSVIIKVRYEGTTIDATSADQFAEGLGLSWDLVYRSHDGTRLVMVHERAGIRVSWRPSARGVPNEASILLARN